MNVSAIQLCVSFSSSVWVQIRFFLRLVFFIFAIFSFVVVAEEMREQNDETNGFCEHIWSILVFELKWSSCFGRR